MTVTSLYWFAAKQQTSTGRRHKSSSVSSSSKFSVEESELTRGFYNPLEVAENLQKANNPPKT